MCPGCGHKGYYELSGGMMAITFCRVDGCHAWRIALNETWEEDGDKQYSLEGGLDGYGLESYRDAVAVIAEEFAEIDAAFFYDLGGHAREVSA